MLTAIMGISELDVFGIMSRFPPHFLTNAGVGLVFYTVFSKIFFFATIYFLAHLCKEKKPGNLSICSYCSKKNPTLLNIT